MKFMMTLVLIGGAIVMLSSCMSPNVEDYAKNEPKLDIRQFLNGDLEAWGTFFTITGKAEPQFFVKMKGTWNGNDGTLEEDFTYNDGRKEHRKWTLHFADDKNFTATASDVIGTATGVQSGNAVNMKYVLTVTTAKGSSYNMSMDDWLFQIDDTHIINRTVMSKFGVKVGELVLGFRKVK